MINLYFGYSTKDMELKYTASSREEVFQEMNRILDSINYEVYYFRSWKDGEGYEHLDFGSHTYFFFIKEV